MYHDYFAGRDLLILPIVAMLAFLITFVALLYRTLKASQRPEFDRMAHLPLCEERAPHPAQEMRP